MLLYFLVNGVVWSMCCSNLYIKMISQKQIADDIPSLYPLEELPALKESIQELLGPTRLQN